MEVMDSRAPWLRPPHEVRGPSRFDVCSVRGSSPGTLVRTIEAVEGAPDWLPRGERLAGVYGSALGDSCPCILANIGFLHD